MAFKQTFYNVSFTTGQSTSALASGVPEYVQVVYEQPPGFEQVPSSSNAVQPPRQQCVQQYMMPPGAVQQFLVYEQPPGFEQLTSISNAVQAYHQPPQQQHAPTFPGQGEVSKQGKHAVLVYDVLGGRLSYVFMFHRKTASPNIS